MDVVRVLVIADDVQQSRCMFARLQEDARETFLVRLLEPAAVQDMHAPLDDIILIDLHGEAGEGFVLAERLFREDPCAQIILVGDANGYETARRAMDAGVSCYLARTEISPELLLQEHGRMMDRVQAVNDWKKRMQRMIREGHEPAEQNSSGGAAVRAMDYVRRNYARNISSADVAAHAGVSESHLRRLFKTETGRSFVDFLTDCRIEAAKDMMRAGELRTGVIAEQAGFSSARYFCSVFKKTTGMTTREYMRGKQQEP